MLRKLISRFALEHRYYLLLAGLVHAVTATIATYRKRKFIKKAPAKNGVLAITAIAGLIFVGVHLLDLRFGEETYVRVGNESVRDLFGLQMKLFSSPGRVLFYEAGVLAIGVHLWKGWTKAARKMDVESKELKKAFEVLGHALVLPVCGAFSICPMYVYWMTRSAGVVHDGL